MKNKILTIISGVIILVVGGLLIIDTNNTKKINDVRKEQQINELKYQTTETSTKEETKPTTTTTTKTTTTANNYKQLQTTKKVVKTTKKVDKKTTPKVTNTKGSYKLTHYGWDCKGCGGKTASGYNVKNTIYYNDATYGKLHIFATSKDIPLYSVIEITNYKFGKITGIVLDRGVSKGVIDILCESEKKSSQMGIQNNAKIKILRWGK